MVSVDGNECYCACANLFSVTCLALSCLVSFTLAFEWLVSWSSTTASVLLSVLCFIFSVYQDDKLRMILRSVELLVKSQIGRRTEQSDEWPTADHYRPVRKDWSHCKTVSVRQALDVLPG